MKYLGVDYGTKRVGLALSNEEGTIAFPREVLLNDEALLPTLKHLIQEEKIEHIVLGDTRTFSGADNRVTAESDLFAQDLGHATGLGVSRASEAWSSVEASRFAPKGKTHDDSASAAIILQRFLDMQPKR